VAGGRFGFILCAFSHPFWVWNHLDRLALDVTALEDRYVHAEKRYQSEKLRVVLGCKL